MTTARSLGGGWILFLFFLACGEDRSTGGRIGTDNTLTYRVLDGGLPVAGARVVARRAGVPPEQLGGAPALDDQLTDDSGVAVLRIPEGVERMDLQVRAGAKGMFAASLPLARRDSLQLAPLLAATGSLTWNYGTSSVCPAAQCGVWLEGTDLWSALPDSNQPIVWSEVPDTWARPVLWFRGPEGVRLVRFQVQWVRPSAGRVVLMAPGADLDSIYAWAPRLKAGCRIQLPISYELDGLPVCK